MVRREYQFLDDEVDRRQFIARMREVREAVIGLRSVVPEARWYEARHEGWSLAALMGHLQWMDRLHLLQVQLAIWNLPFPFSARTWARVSVAGNSASFGAACCAAALRASARPCLTRKALCCNSPSKTSASASPMRPLARP